jgi:putative transcriptional regulator
MKHTIMAITNITTVPMFTPAAVKAVIKRLKLTEKSLALLMNVSPTTVRMWTKGVRKPCGLARRMLQLYSLYPELIKILAKSESDVG